MTINTNNTKTLRLSTLHLAVTPYEPEKNLLEFMRQTKKAAANGAQMVVGPEMALAGYSFADRKQIAPYVESFNGPVATALSALAKELKIFIVASWPEIDHNTTLYYNSSFVFNPRGELVLRYRKVTAESRWATPGQATQENTFPTPWGRFGLLICSDSYHSMLARATAIRGAELLIIPATWPPTGSFPTNIWRMRALENGYYLLAAGRTGQDVNFDCRTSESLFISPRGEVLKKLQSPHSEILSFDLPLKHGRLSSLRRGEILAARRLSSYTRSAGNFSSLVNLTQFLNLPTPGPLPIRLLASSNLTKISGQDIKPQSLLLLPQNNYSDAELTSLHNIAQEKKIAILLARPEEVGISYFALEEKTFTKWEINNNTCDFPFWDYGPARVGLAPLKELFFPELALSLAKFGCDLIFAAESQLDETDRMLATLRPIEQTAVAVCALNGAALGTPPQGHSVGDGAEAESDNSADFQLNTTETRRKRFLDRLDFETIFRPIKGGSNVTGKIL